MDEDSLSSGEGKQMKKVKVKYKNDVHYVDAS